MKIWSPTLDPMKPLTRKWMLVLISKDGSKYLIDFSIAPILDLQNTNIGSVLVFHDITNQRQSGKRIA